MPPIEGARLELKMTYDSSGATAGSTSSTLGSLLNATGVAG